MSLVWHIVKKDLRRMAWPVGAWVVFVVGTSAWFRFATLGDRGAGPAEVGEWLALMNIWTRLLIGGALVMGYLLTGALALEDGLQGTNAFWMTRPIRGSRLLVAKLTAAALLFVVAPTIGMMAVWFSCGFDLQNVVLAMRDFAAWQIAVTLPAVTIASLAGSLAEFLFCSVGFVVMLVAGVFVTMPFAPSGPTALNNSRTVLTVAGIVLTMGMVLTHQYLTRRRTRTWRMVGIAFALGMVIRVAWPWDFWTPLTAYREKAQTEERLEDRAAEIVVRSLSARNRFRDEIPLIKVTAPWTRSSLDVPLTASLDDHEATFRAYNGWQKAGERLLGFSDSEGAITWLLSMDQPRAKIWSGEPPPRLTGKLDIWSAHARILGEAPLRIGGELSDGALHLRIVGLQRTGDQLDGIFVEEHEAAPMRATRLETTYYNTLRERMGRGNHLDCYFLVDRVNRRIQPLDAWEEWDFGSHAVRMNSLTTTVQKLFVGGIQSWEGAVVSVVRFERDHAFTRPFAVQATTVEPVEGKP